MNFTLQVPAGTTNHGEPSLICLPPIWSDYFVFFATNYFTHVATLVSRPGEARAEQAIDMANALFVPGSGALRAFRIMLTHASFERWDALQEAAKAGALVMVVKTENLTSSRPDPWFRRAFEPNSSPTILPSRRSVFGTCRLPLESSHARHEYQLVEVPAHVPLCPYHESDSEQSPPYSRAGQDGPDADPETDRERSRHGRHHGTERRRRRHLHRHHGSTNGSKSFRKIRLAKSPQGPKAIISILQIVWSCITLYRTRDPQIALYGYGALAFTVTPYTIMSVVNLACNLLRSNFTNLYLVHTPDMDAARADGGHFWGMVASLDVDAMPDPVPLDPQPMSLTRWLLQNAAGYLILSLVPIIVVGAFTNFSSGTEGSSLQVGWILAWIIVGSTSSLYVGLLEKYCRRLDEYFLLSTPLWVPAVGGFIVVGQILHDFGICTSFRSS